MAASIDALLPQGTPQAEPGVEHPRAQLVWQFAQQARACQAMDSELYADLLARAAGDIAEGGPCWALVGEYVNPGRGRAIALRLMAAVHRLVLTGRAPELAAHYASVGGTAGVAGAWPVFLALVEERAGELAPLVALPCQTNEVGRSAALAVGLLDVARRTGLPLELLEIGTAAGLNLRWDHFRYAGGGQAWGDPASPVDLSGFWVDVPEVDGTEVRVVGRRGVDRSPIDPTTEDGRLAISAAVWGDQRARLDRLDGAVRLARALPADVVAGEAVEWVEDQLSPTAGTATVLMQSVLREYLTPPMQERLERAVAAAGARASEDAPIAWLRLEPVSAARRHGLVLTTWPGGEERFLTTSGSLGADVRRAHGQAPELTE